MSIFDQFSDYQLTQDQQTALAAVEHFVADPQRSVLLLKGYAGTGKTFLLRGIAQYLTSQQRSVRGMAPTGRAARVLAEKAGLRATTIHKAIYNYEKLEEYEPETDHKDETFKYYFGLKANGDPVQSRQFDPKDAVYLVDEASMISNAYSEGEFFRFGSGHLLNDLLEYAWLNLGRKIIFVGDPAQLPPVTESLSRALDVAELEQLLGKGRVVEVEMTEVIRQQEGSGILSHATMLRKGIQQQSYTHLDLHDRYADVHAFDLPTQLKDQYVAGVKAHGITGAAIITYSNREAAACNAIIRGHYFPDQPRATRGDWMLVNQNSTLYPTIIDPLANGEFGQLLEVGESERRRVSIRRKDGERVSVLLSFCPVKMKVERGGEVVMVEALMLENQLYQLNPTSSESAPKPGEESWLHQDRDISRDEKIALYVDAVMRAEKAGLKRKTPAFKEFLRNDPYFHSLHLKFGYAITCHKAQGGEWPAAWVSMDSGQGKTNEAYFRWAYTAITRAKGHLHLYQAPRFTAFSDMTWMETTLPFAPKAEAQAVELTDELTQWLNQHQLAQAEAFLQGHALRLRAAADTCGAAMTQRQPQPYLEMYYFRRGNETARIHWHYNGKQQVKPGTIQPSGTTSMPLAEEILAALTQTPPMKLDTPAPTPTAQPPVLVPDFSGVPVELERLFDGLQAELAPMSIAITQVTHQLHAAHYTFARGEEVARVIFDYKSAKGIIFGTVRPIDTQCNSQQLLEDLQAVVRQLSHIDLAPSHA